MTSLRVIRDDVFAAPLPAGEARLVYADPPYTLDDVHGYGIWPDPERLIRRMHDLAAEDAALCCTAAGRTSSRPSR